MREFFRGWRRKVGCVALVMACAVTGMWIRSRSTSDWIVIRTGRSTKFIIGSNAGTGCFKQQSFFQTSLDGPILGWISERKSRGEYDGILPKIIHGGGGTLGPNERLRVTVRSVTLYIPYPISAIPLTLLSAYLLIWQPRKRTGADHA